MTDPDTPDTPDTPDIADRVTVRLGPLRPLLARRLARTGQIVSEYLRQVMASDLGVDPPEMRGGNPDIGMEAARRWDRRNTQRDRRVSR